MKKLEELKTWGDLLAALKTASAEQLKQPVQICQSHPVYEYVHALQSGICIGTLDELDILYARSVIDNRRHGDHLVIYTDGNPFGEDGAIAYEVEVDTESEGMAELFSKKKAIYPKNHDESKDWTGPAQKLADEAEKNRERGRGTIEIQINHRINKNLDLKGHGNDPSTLSED